MKFCLERHLKAQLLESDLMPECFCIPAASDTRAVHMEHVHNCTSSVARCSRTERGVG